MTQTAAGRPGAANRFSPPAPFGAPTSPVRLRYDKEAIVDRQLSVSKIARFALVVALFLGQLGTVFAGTARAASITPAESAAPARAVADAETYWTIETVDPGAGIGLHSSLAIDSADRLHVAYYDQPNTALRYAVFNGMHGNLFDWQTTANCIEPTMLKIQTQIIGQRRCFIDIDLRTRIDTIQMRKVTVRVFWVIPILEPFLQLTVLADLHRCKAGPHIDQLLAELLVPA